ncbi:hypothetical protein D3C79_1013490 [compost metagenome]
MPLGHTVAHGRYTTGHLTDSTHRVQRLLQPLRVVFVGLVGGQHVVMGGNDGDIAMHHVFQRVFIIRLAGSEAVRQVAAGQLCTMYGL